MVAETAAQHRSGAPGGALRPPVMPASEGFALTWRWSLWLLAWWAGVGGQCAQPALWPGSVYAALVLVGGLLGGAAVAVWHRSRRTSRAAVWGGAVALILVAAGSTGWRAVERWQRQLPVALEGVVLELQGEIEGLVQAVPARNGTGQRLVLRVQQAWRNGEPVTVPERVELTWWPPGQPEGAALPPPAWTTGSQWRLQAQLRRPDGLRNPSLWDYEQWLWTRGIGATGTVVTQPAAPQWLAAPTGWRWDRLREQVRERMRRHGLSAQPTADPESEAGASMARHARSQGLVVALLTGDQRAIAGEDWQRFRHTGIVHLFSVSGLHVTMFAWGMMALVQALWHRSAWLCRWWPAPRAGMQWGWAAALAYALFSGWGVPAQRTVFMLGWWMALRTLGVRWPWWMTWGLAGACILAVDPWAWWQPGFWLSFVAVGLLMATSWPVYAQGRSLCHWGRAFLREQGILLLALTPWLLWWFGEWSTVSWLVNALAIPWVTLVLTPLSFAGVVWPPLWDAATWSAWVLLWGIEPMAQWPHAVWHVATPPWWAAAALALGGLLLVMPAPWRVRCAGLAFVAPALLWRAPAPPPGQVELWALDVGQGSAVVVRTARHTLVYDTGPRHGLRSDAGERVLVPWLRRMGWTPDRIVLSHSDTDHTGGVAALQAAYPQTPLFGPMTHWQGRPVEPCHAGVQWQWDGVQFLGRHPAGPLAGEKAANADSCVIQILVSLHHKGAKVQPPIAAWLTGDMEALQERELAPLASRTPVYWMLAPHHGSAGGSSPAWVQASRAQLVVVQAGHRNRYGHPAPAVVSRWQAAGASVVTTAQCGALRWRSWEPQQWECERERHRGYWQSR